MPLSNIEAQIQELIMLLNDLIFKTGKIVASINDRMEKCVLIIYFFLDPPLCFSLNSY